MEKVTIEFKFLNLVNNNENKPGILLQGNIVFVEDTEGMGLYQAIPTLISGLYQVDLDDPKCIVEHVSVIDLIAEAIEGMRAS